MVIDTAVLTRLFVYNGEFPVKMRATPTRNYWSDTGTSDRVNEYSNNATELAISSTDGTNQRNIAAWLNVTSNASATMAYRFHFEASAEI